MKRLFLSLYAVVVLALVVIGWSTEQLWRLVQSNSNDEVVQLTQLVKTIHLITDVTRPQQLKRLEQQLGYSIVVLSIDDIAWYGDQLNLLKMGEPVISYDSQDRLLLYLVVEGGDRMLQIGPLTANNPANTTAKLLYFLSYLLLAVVIGLWSRPLWRDLRILQQATENFGRGQWQQVPKVSRNSVIVPVVDTFKVMSARISRLVSEQKELTNAVSHELRTPLARLKFSLALLDGEDQKTQQAVTGMAADIKELEALVDEMLSYSRLESDARSLALENVNLSELLQNLVEKLSFNSNKRIELVIADELYWRCDGHFLERAVQNLVTNATRYADSYVRVLVSISSDLCIVVEDDGAGIDKAEQGKVFKPFVRLDKSRAKDKGGFGLGLAIVKRIMDWHQGKVMVGDSELGGAKFTLVFPCNYFT